MSILRRGLLRFGRWPYVLMWAGLILLLSSIPNNFPASEPSELNADKLVHFGLFFMLAALGTAAGIRTVSAAPKIAIAMAAVTAAGLFGAGDEVYQRLIPGRDPNVWDWTADLAGAVAGAGAASVLIRGTRGDADR